LVTKEERAAANNITSNHDLASGNAESLEDAPINSEQEYENFDDFAQRSSHQERRRQLFGRSLHPDRIPTASQMEPELLCDRPN